MTQWVNMSQLLPFLPDQTINDLYPPTTFPIEARHFLAEWVESQRWEDFTLDNVEQKTQAEILFNEALRMLQSMAHQNTNVVDRMKLMQISRNMAVCHQPLEFAVMVRNILRNESAMISMNTQIPAPEPTLPSMQDVDHLVLKVLDVQDTRQKMHQLQEELNWEKHNCESFQGPQQHNGLDQRMAEIQKVQSKIQQLDYNLKSMATKRFQLLKECINCLDQCQSRLISRLKLWRWEQHKATIGHPFDDNLNPLQTWCEQLLGVNGKLRQELMLIGEPIPELQERLGHLLQVLIQSSLVVEKQPPQVIKTQSKFSTTVRYLLGEKIAPGKPVVLKAQIINESQAKNQGSLPGDTVGELINNTAILEHNTASKSTCATFRNMSIKKIKRADRKGTESVTEEKFALIFSTEITITGCDTPYRIQMISLPLVVIVHGSQDNNALATIIWDCAFCELDRVPFVVPEYVPWRKMYNTLNSKFTSEVQTKHNLDKCNQHFLAQKIFDKPDYNGDFSNMMVSWAQFNKEVLPGRMFTFWQWFEGVMELTKKHLRTYWSEKLIFGFIGKQHLHLILKDKPNGTFLLRFSDSEIGGITIAYVSTADNGGLKIQNIQPFTKRDLEIRSLGDRILDINHITHLYPNCPKHEVFQKFYTEPQASPSGGYIPVSLQTKVGTEAASTTHQTPSMAGVCPSPSMVCPSPSMAGVCPSPSMAGVCPSPSMAGVNPSSSMTVAGDTSPSSVGYPLNQFQQQQYNHQDSLHPDMDVAASPPVEFLPVLPTDNMDNMDLDIESFLQDNTWREPDI
ncbi:signal transducer and activator of transcription 6 isoform X1 [Takifugu rubripes]|uniref:Signal transducer and activator of transcription n=2 Tax=Takifugu rubripes TaxID=31033 RepID=H2UT58_TAKRU|nr:signal transducer and activator of transcription 5B-like isoform X1 [Takifugu rubripes]XP_011620217.1 signal transducer and activator of transcription 5B-like isoform X1 [Takifugu rubripes]|eukprot:XP_003963141.1 PREDICTED: signal transducer and activator of transcription 5B-like isoform X1 [Takifugu rubripes]